MNTKRKFHYLRKTARITCFGGGALVLLVIIAFFAIKTYAAIVSTTDTDQFGMLVTIMVFLVAPVGLFLLVLGGLMWIGLSFVDSSSGQQHTDTD